MFLHQFNNRESESRCYHTKRYIIAQFSQNLFANFLRCVLCVALYLRFRVDGEALCSRTATVVAVRRQSTLCPQHSAKTCTKASSDLRKKRPKETRLLVVSIDKGISVSLSTKCNVLPFFMLFSICTTYVQIPLNYLYDLRDKMFRL